MLARFNFASALAMNKIKGTTIDTAKMTSSGSSPSKAADKIAEALITGEVSEKTRAALEKLAADFTNTSQAAIIPAGATSLAPPATPESRAAALHGQLVALALGAPEFQRK